MIDEHSHYSPRTVGLLTSFALNALFFFTFFIVVIHTAILLQGVSKKEVKFRTDHFPE